MRSHKLFALGALVLASSVSAQSPGDAREFRQALLTTARDLISAGRNLIGMVPAMTPSQVSDVGCLVNRWLFQRSE
jgi:hypothetical protein